SRAQNGPQLRSRNVQLIAQRGRHVAQRLHVESVHQKTGEAQQVGADLKRAYRAFVDDAGDVDLHTHGASSRHNPNALCTGRSEKLNNTASPAAWCDTGHHEGTTKTSFS